MGDTFSNLVQMFEQSAARYRDRPLFGVKRGGRYEWLTYGEIGEQVAAFRAGLASLGVAKGDRVAMISNNRPEWAVAAYATYSLGAQFVPMYEAQLDKEWEYILEDCGAKLLIVPNTPIHVRTERYTKHIASLEHVIDLEGAESTPTSYAGLLRVGRANPVPSAKPDPSEVCGFIYTSGTTGNPKGVLLSHGNITSNINAVHSIFPMSSDDVSLCFLPWAHSFGQTVELHCLLSYGAAMGLAESVNTIIENLSEVRPTLLFSVPRIFNRIYEGVHKRMAAEGGVKQALFERTLTVAGKRRALSAQGKSSLLLDVQHTVLDKLVGAKIRERFGGRLRYAFSGGAALSKEVGEFVDSLGITVYEGYGLTETSPIATANFPGNQRIGSVGKAIPDVRVEIGPAEVAPEGQGEVIIYGPNVMQGYHNLPEETAHVFTADGGFRTGDLGRIDSDGFVYITGRVKEQYKLENGKYVAPAPLEEKLKLSPCISNLMIDGTNRLYNIAVIVPDMENLREWARENGVTAANDAALCQDPGVKSHVEREIERHSTDFKRFERIGRFILTPEDFTTENDMLTPKMSLKRRNVMAKYGPAIDALYAE